MMEDENERVSKDDVECWGLRYSYIRVMLTNPKRHAKLISKVEADLKALGEGACFTMEPENVNLGYVYIMFFDKKEKEAFYASHKDEKAYKDGRLTDIEAPAYIPRKFFPDGYLFRNKA